MYFHIEIEDVGKLACSQHSKHIKDIRSLWATFTFCFGEHILIIFPGYRTAKEYFISGQPSPAMTGSMAGYLWTHPNVQLLDGYPEA